MSRHNTFARQPSPTTNTPASATRTTASPEQRESSHAARGVDRAPTTDTRQPLSAARLFDLVASGGPAAARRAFRQLHRQYGNRAVQRMIEAARLAPPIVPLPTPAESIAEPAPVPLPEAVRSGIEQASGRSLEAVHVHYNSAKPAALQAKAYTQGTDIHIAPGQEQHLPHEAWHVVQQQQGRVRPTLQVGGVALNTDLGLEHEAELLGGQALRQLGEPPQPRSAGDLAQPQPTPGTAGAPAQHGAPIQMMRYTKEELSQQIARVGDSGDIPEDSLRSLLDAIFGDSASIDTAKLNEQAKQQLNTVLGAVGLRETVSEPARPRADSEGGLPPPPPGVLEEQLRSIEEARRLEQAQREKAEVEAEAEEAQRTERERYRPLEPGVPGGYDEALLSEQVLASNQSYDAATQFAYPLVQESATRYAERRLNFNLVQPNLVPFLVAYNSARRYHGTSRENAEKIETEGLLPERRGGKGGAEANQAKALLQQQGIANPTDDQITAEVQRRGKDKERQGVYTTTQRRVASTYPPGLESSERQLLRTFQDPEQAATIVPDIEYESDFKTEATPDVGYTPTAIQPSNILFDRFDTLTPHEQNKLYEIIRQSWPKGAGEPPSVAELQKLHQRAQESGYVSE